VDSICKRHIIVRKPPSSPPKALQFNDILHVSMSLIKAAAQMRSLAHSRFTHTRESTRSCIALGRCWWVVCEGRLATPTHIQILCTCVAVSCTHAFYLMPVSGVSTCADAIVAGRIKRLPKTSHVTHGLCTRQTVAVYGWPVFALKVNTTKIIAGHD
jgi:hypothetical protein